MIYNAYQMGDDGIAGVSVVSSGHIFAQYGRCIDRPNGRDDHLLFYVNKGEELFYLDGDRVAASGSFIIFKPHEKQEHIYIGKERGEFYYVHFNAPKDFDLFGLESSTVYTSRADAVLCDIFEGIITELILKRPSYEKLCASMLFSLFALLKRSISGSSVSNEKSLDKITYVINIMSRCYGEETSLDEYAAMSNMSKFHFIREFKNITGCSPMEYKNRIRIEHAKELLENTNDSVSEIGKKTGFMSDAYFCDAFKKKTGMSPNQYRKNNR